MALLSSTKRYAAGTLLAIALRQAQTHQSIPHHPLAQDIHVDASVVTAADPSDMWTHESRGLLHSVFRVLEIDPMKWAGIEETSKMSDVKQQIEAYIRMIFEEDCEDSPRKSEHELALAKAVDAMVKNLENAFPPKRTSVEMEMKQEHDSHGIASPKLDGKRSEAKLECLANLDAKNSKGLLLKEVELIDPAQAMCGEMSLIEDTPCNQRRKVLLLYELLSACLADTQDEKEETSKVRKGYDARHRVTLRLLATWLDVKWIKVEAMEIMIACSAMAAVSNEMQLQEGESEESQWSKWKQGGIIGAAALTGGALLAITGGLAAPAIAAGFSALAPTLGTIVPVIGASGFAAMASAAGSVAGSVAVAASFGAAGAGLSGSKMARRIADIEEFEFKPIGENHNQGRLGVGILISGFVFGEEDFTRPWEESEVNLERYALQWESKNLIALSTAIQDWLRSKITSELMKQGAMLTVLSSLVAALAWPTTLLSATNFIDSTWSIAIDRSDKAGKLLAEVLLKGLQGNRPVTLIGFSLGARVIYRCLEILAQSKDNEGLIEKVVFLGAPISVKGEQWELVRKVVAGRFINAYSTNDWILGITYRASLLTQGLAGIQPLDISGVENVDVTDFIDGHSSYLWTVNNILEQLELESCYPIFSPLPQEKLDSVDGFSDPIGLAPNFHDHYVI